MHIEIKNIIGSSNAISQSDGHALYEKLVGANLSDVVIGFNNIQFLSTAFLNASIGKLAGKYPKSVISNLKFDIPKDRNLFKSKIDRVIDNAFLDNFSQIVNEATS